MNEERVAKYLRVSGRAVRRYAARGKLTARRDGTDGRAVYDDGELQSLKNEMDARALLTSASDISLTSKCILSLDEAIVLSGLSRQTLLQSILEGNLEAKSAGSGYVVGRDELEELARTL
jgi:hypothetical protein